MYLGRKFFNFLPLFLQDENFTSFLLKVNKTWALGSVTNSYVGREFEGWQGEARTFDGSLYFTFKVFLISMIYGFEQRKNCNGILRFSLLVHYPGPSGTSPRLFVDGGVISFASCLQVALENMLQCAKRLKQIQTSKKIVQNKLWIFLKKSKQKVKAFSKLFRMLSFLALKLYESLINLNFKAFF